jgi:hypothetical protein
MDEKKNVYVSVITQKQQKHKNRWWRRRRRVGESRV